MTIKLKISAKTLTIGDVIAAEELPEKPKNRQLAEFLARFVVDDDGVKAERDQALELIMSLPLQDLPDLVRQLQEAITSIQEGAVPLVTSES